MNIDRLGIGTLTWASKPITEAIKNAVDLGFTKVDLGILNDWTEFGAVQLAQNFDKYAKPVRNTLERYGVTAISINANIKKAPDCPSPQEQAEALAKAAVYFGCSAGITLPTAGVDDDVRDVARGLKPILDTFHKYNTDLIVETHSGTTTERIDKTIDLLNALPGLKVTLDASHYIIRGYKPSEIVKLIPWTGHAHIRPCGTDGWDTIQIEASDCTPLMYEWIVEMEKAGYNKMYGFEVIENFSIKDVVGATVYMRDRITG
jgi:sugar phosphate isomerase/epimerase